VEDQSFNGQQQSRDARTASPKPVGKLVASGAWNAVRTVGSRVQSNRIADREPQDVATPG
jgi:hypothetical protein